ncbi:UMP kinase [Luxibacter massiliensis]|uniref:UMP kinase n=1 Tax=Luxibacter massiliensis TaxID=2219695 RepID=UPI000F059A9C|nr:UMP kinase [Luxibacter massiliensis]
MKRVLLKLSGEALAGDKKTGFDEATCMGVARQVKQLVDQGIQVAVVTGGGNFWRGRTSETIDRAKADQIGMLATVMNCIYVSDIFRHVGMQTEIFTPFACSTFTALFSKDAALAALEQGKVIFFAGGTGHPYFSTDTGAVLRAVEIEADAMLLAKAIDGIYDSDPKVNPQAEKYEEISIQEVIDRKLAAVDLAASILCMENKMPMLVFGLNEENSIANTISGKFTGTKVTV